MKNNSVTLLTGFLLVLLPSVSFGSSSSIGTLNLNIAGTEHAYKTADEKIKSLIELADQELNHGNNLRAITLYTRILNLPDSPFHAMALEFRGIAEQRSGQQNQAKSTYEDYLLKYPDSVAAERVHQRLQVLINQEEAQEKKITELQDREAKTFRPVDAFNQYSLNSQAHIINENFNKKTTQNLDQLDFSSSFRKNGAEWFTLFNADNNYNEDLQDFSKGIEINTFYISYKNVNKGIISSFGRQNSRGNGITGAFDGLKFQVPVKSRISTGMSLGFPTDPTNKSQLQSNKPFVSLNSIIPFRKKTIELKPYAIIKKSDERIERQAMGTELNYKTKKASLYHITDYDMQSNAFNLSLVKAKFRNYNQTVHHLSLGYFRNSPTNFGKALFDDYQEGSLNKFSKINLDYNANALANDSNAKHFRGSAGSRLNLSENLLINTTLTRTDQIYDIDDVSVAAGKAEHDFQNQISTQFITDNLSGKHETLLLELGYIDAKTFSNSSILIRDEMRLSGNYQLHIQVDTTHWQSDYSSEQWLAVSPTATLLYQTSKIVFSEFQLGYEASNFSGNVKHVNEKQLFANLNLRIDL